MDGLALMVLLRHELPDGTSHYDWLIERQGRPEAGLMAFRVHERIDLPGTGDGPAAGPRTFEAERLPEHRRVYLTYEGEVSGSRGRVIRVAEGRCEVREGPGGFIRINGSFGETPRAFEGRPMERGDLWRFVVSEGPISN